MNDKQIPGWRRKRFKGNKVWMETDEQGNPLLSNNKVRIKYQLDQPHEYWIYPRDLQDPDHPSPAPRVKRTSAKDETAPEPPPDAIILYTDGASSGNPGPSGIGVVMRYGGHTREISKYIGVTTNNVAELEAIRIALEELKRTDLPVYIHTDSSYACGLLVKNWKAKKNLELVGTIRRQLTQFKEIHLIKVRGHQGVPDNERADRLATEAILKNRNAG